MIWQRIEAVVVHEWIGLRRNRSVLLGIVSTPLVLVGTVLVLTAWAINADPASMNMGGSLPPELFGQPVTVQLVIVLNEMIEFMFLIVPAAFPLAMASHSILEEKKARSLEPLLATPIGTNELVLGKAIGAVLPSVLACWLCFALSAVGLLLIAPPIVLAFFVRPAWLAAMLLLVPPLGALAGLMGVAVSSRARDEKSAGLWAGLLVTIVCLAPTGLLISGVLLNVAVLVGTTVSLIVLDLLVLVVAVRLFRREEVIASS